MTPSFREILEVLNQHQVEFIVVGGVAAVIHGSPTTTFDLDTLVKVTRDNAERLSKALTQLEARFREHSAVIRPAVEDILAGGHLLLGMNVGSLRVLGLEALIAEKKRMGRAKDIAAVELLEEVLRHRLQGD
jgi:hypothetical protein